MFYSEIQEGLYNQKFESDACGIGFVVQINNTPTHTIINDALTVLERMEHRGACGCEENTGDGSGIITQIPDKFFREELKSSTIILPAKYEYGVAVIFLPKNEIIQNIILQIIDNIAEELQIKLLGSRLVPVHNQFIGVTALQCEPEIRQFFIKKPEKCQTELDFERVLFLFKNMISHRVNKNISAIEKEIFYISSCSAKTIVYKGQLTSTQLRNYFTDLTHPLYQSSFGMVHSRFATNTFPSWKLAQPFRYIAHNGEINTLQGNINWFNSNENSFISQYFSAKELDLLKPIIFKNQSDSACLDNVIELLYLCGRDLSKVLMMLIPEVWHNNNLISQNKKDFYEFQASIMEPWDGPAAICFTQGDIIGATLDRNGLRPARFTITNDGRFILSSEAGVLDIEPENIKKHGSLQPGKMILVDLIKGKIIEDEEIKQEICNQNPYAAWLEKFKINLENLPQPRLTFSDLNPAQIFKYQKAFGYSREDIEETIIPMALNGQEPIGSMGADIPLAILSQKPQHISSYFKQLFAQVTNPPIDPIREKMVMSLVSYVGGMENLLEETPEDCKTLALSQPILNNYDLERIRSIDLHQFQAKTLQTYFRADDQKGSLQAGLDRLCNYAKDAINDNFKLLILSDRAIDSEHCAIPSLLACSAVHNFLIKEGLRTKVGIIIECGDVWEVHHFACLISFGASAINPYLALSTIKNEFLSNKINNNIPLEDLQRNYIEAINYGLLKIFSKMGISTLQSYQGAQTFEILGICQEVVKQYFCGCTSRIEGINLDDLADEALKKHYFAYKDKKNNHLIEKGIWQWKRQGEFHLFNPQTIHLLQLATRQNNYEVFKKYSKLIDETINPACTLRQLLTFKSNRPPISIEQVEPAEKIYRRFATGAMSFGSISWEAHTTLAIAMNKLGGKSNTGEGGEDEIRYQLLPNGDNQRSAIKQVASARFGVTSNYLTQADEIQIKIAQGAKPGEGGQLPGHKVDEWIGKTRFAIPGVGLISPPPHHDIYSIEDLAQLIFDLKNANPKARINVKLVSKAGVGTIAAGVTKARADVILISGFDGGTGASPLSSIKEAGLPWELGLAETQQTLVKNGLRSRVVVQTDGQIRTGRDLAIATLLGAEEWGIATAALVVEGCILMRKCHLNTCPVGIATQNIDLRKRFAGEAEHVINFFKFLTQELREIMAELGFRTINEMVGQAQYLQPKPNLPSRYNKINWQSILYHTYNTNTTYYKSQSQPNDLVDILDQKLVKLAANSLINLQPIYQEHPIKNIDRTTGTLLSHQISTLYQSKGLPTKTIHYKFIGTAGQSFASFSTNGVLLEIEGAANDYVGKGLCGATIVIYPPQKAQFSSNNNKIIGNVAFYGATSGSAYISGLANERFAVRNSGATIVVEGLGNHGCEYMTSGKVIVLGEIGKNFGAGMSGGLAYIFQTKEKITQYCNLSMVDLEEVESAEDQDFLKTEIKQHYTYTKSKIAAEILQNFDLYLKNFTKIFPKEYKKILLKK